MYKDEMVKLSKLKSDELLKKYKSKKTGLTSIEASKRLKENGLNIAEENPKHGSLYFLLNAFNDKFIFILIVLAVINYFLSDHVGSYIIIGIGVVSGLIKYFENYNVYKFNNKLKEKIYSTTDVYRNNKLKNIRVDNVVVGDIASLRAGSVIPGDMILLESKDLFLNEASFTGENIPVEKNSENNQENELFKISNVCFMGSNVVSGSGHGIIVKTGINTYIASINKSLTKEKNKTNFDMQISSITKLLITYMIIVCLCVLVIYGVIRHDFLEAILFALSVAVGITPSMLPMIVNVNLTRGTKVLASKKSLVKNINSIENLGAMDILCTDKTGTLTESKITVQKYIDVLGCEDKSILEYGYLNSYYSTGSKNIIDNAIISYGKINKIDEILPEYEKIDEIPFDYERKIQSVVVKDKKSTYRMFTKGALEEILKISTKVKINGKIKNLTETEKKSAIKKAQELEYDGMQVIALSTKREYRGENIFDKSDEKDMIFIGFMAFLDPPKKDAEKTIKMLENIGVKTKIITGDNQYSASTICGLVGINNNEILTGNDIDKLTDKELSKIVEDIDLYARVNPMQKMRVVKALRNNGHVIAYIGDGVNDAPSLKEADVGICVDTGASTAKEASDIILLEKSLKVVYDGVVSGRVVYGNITKYMKMALSSDFGDVFSIVIASIFLPFLPLLPIQMLFQDFLYDISQVAIPYDNVDEEFIKKPHRWNISDLSRFMNYMGITSSIIDILAFLGFWFIFKYNQSSISYFQTAWFVECLISETLIIHFVRTSKKPFIESYPDKRLLIGTIITIFGTIISPILLHNIKSFNFEILPLNYYLFVIVLVFIYAILVSIVKKIYIKKYKHWL